MGTRHPGGTRKRQGPRNQRGNPEQVANLAETAAEARDETAGKIEAMTEAGIVIADIVDMMMIETAITAAIGIALDLGEGTIIGGDPPHVHEAARAAKTMVIIDTIVRSEHTRPRNADGTLVAVETESILIAETDLRRPSDSQRTESQQVTF